VTALVVDREILKKQLLPFWLLSLSQQKGLSRMQP
jgi:hypothetical protein